MINVIPCFSIQKWRALSETVKTCNAVTVDPFPVAFRLTGANE